MISFETVSILLIKQRRKRRRRSNFSAQDVKKIEGSFIAFAFWQKGRNWSIGSITSTVEIIPQGGNLSFFLLHPLRSLVSYHQVCMCMCSLKHTQIFINNIIEIAFLHIIKSANLYLTHSHVANIILIQYQPEPKKKKKHLKLLQFKQQERGWWDAKIPCLLHHASNLCNLICALQQYWNKTTKNLQFNPGIASCFIFRCLSTQFFFLWWGNGGGKTTTTTPSITKQYTVRKYKAHNAMNFKRGSAGEDWIEWVGDGGVNAKQLERVSNKKRWNEYKLLCCVCLCYATAIFSGNTFFFYFTVCCWSPTPSIEPLK